MNQWVYEKDSSVTFISIKFLWKNLLTDTQPYVYSFIY